MYVKACCHGLNSGDDDQGLLAESIIVYPDAGRYICNIKVIIRGFWSIEDLYYVSHRYVVILTKSGFFFKTISVSPVSTHGLLELTAAISYIVLLQKISGLLTKLLSCLLLNVFSD